MPRFSFRNICNGFIGGLLALLAVARPLWAFPNQEKAVLSILSSQATSFLMSEDRFLISSAGSSISIIDTETFSLATDQVPALIDNSAATGGVNLTGDVTGMAIRSSTLFAAQADGDFLTIDLNDVTAQPASTHVIDGALGAMVADTETAAADSKLYLLDKTNNAVVVYDTTSNTSSSIPLVDSLGAPVTPNEIVFTAFPTDASTSSADKVYVTSDRGLVFVINEGGTTASQIVLSPTNKDLVAAALTPGRDFLLVVDATDTVVHVIDTASDTEVDTDPVTSGVNPIALSQNGSLRGIVVTDVSNPADVYAYVTGSSGLSVIDLNLTAVGVFSQPTVIDLNDTGSGDTADNPLALTSSPGAIAASSAGDGYVYASDGNAAISVITEKPFVTIGSTSLGSGPLTLSGSFTLTFRSGETGTYSVLVGGDLSRNGSEVATGTVDTADTDVTTSAISFDAAIFAEGSNRVFVFVTDSSGTVGRDAVDITVDTPPPGVEILDTKFGNEKIYVTFSRLTATDIDHYNIYVTSDASTIATTTEVAGTLTQPSSGDTIDAKIVGLINGVQYFIGIEGVDQAGNVGPRTTTLSDGSPATETPEETVGLAASLGEAGCGLDPHVTGSWMGILWLGVGLVILLGGRSPKGPLWGKLRPTILFLFIFFMPHLVSAEEKTPQWFSLEFKGGVWLPLNGTTKDFLGALSPTGMAEFGFLYHSKYGAEVGVGYVGAGGSAVGRVSGAVSGDRFNLTMIPICNSFTFRADFKEDQFLVPYVKAGPDYVLYRENVQGNVTKGVKLGLHAAAGLQILLDKIEDLSDFMEVNLGVNDVFFVVEGRYGWINNFGGGGLDLSNLTLSGGLLFEF